MNTDTAPEDADITWFFENFESVLNDNEPSADQLAQGVDFLVFKEYLINDIREIQASIDQANDDDLRQVCEHLFNIIEWIRLINEARSQNFGVAIERVFVDTFGDRHILQHHYDASINKWLKNKDGQYKLGDNTYSVLNRNLYYRDRFERWFQVEKAEAFDLQPNKKPVEEEAIVALLNSTYRPTSTDEIIEKWNAQDFHYRLPDEFLKLDSTTTTPEDYFSFSMPQIQSLLENPVSIKELERWYGDSIINLEDTIKLTSTILNIVEVRRKDEGHTLYLLRDCILFYEAHKALDILSANETSSDQILVGRKFLSNKEGIWGHYIVILEALYEAHKRYPDDFSKFYDEFVRLLDILVSINPAFQKVVTDLSAYISKHIPATKHKIVIFDVGFQGTINLLMKYVIDRHINPTIENKIETEIEIGVGAQWSKSLFKNRFKSDYFPFLNRVQSMARSDNLYHYKFGSFDLAQGTVTVQMEDEDWQRKAAVELVVLVMIAKLSRET